jgi:hypothetical protein
MFKEHFNQINAILTHFSKFKNIIFRSFTGKVMRLAFSPSLMMRILSTGQKEAMTTG